MNYSAIKTWIGDSNIRLHQFPSWNAGLFEILDKATAIFFVREINNKNSYPEIMWCETEEDAEKLSNCPFDGQFIEIKVLPRYVIEITEKDKDERSPLNQPNKYHVNIKVEHDEDYEIELELLAGNFNTCSFETTYFSSNRAEEFYYKREDYINNLVLEQYSIL